MNERLKRGVKRVKSSVLLQMSVETGLDIDMYVSHMHPQTQSIPPRLSLVVLFAFFKSGRAFIFSFFNPM